MTDLSLFFKKLSAPLDRPYKRIAALLLLLSFPLALAGLVPLLVSNSRIDSWIDSLLDSYIFEGSVRYLLMLNFARFYRSNSFYFSNCSYATYFAVLTFLCSYGAKYWLDPLIAWIKNGNSKD